MKEVVFLQRTFYNYKNQLQNNADECVPLPGVDKLRPGEAPGKFRQGADASDKGANYFGSRALKPDRS